MTENEVVELMKSSRSEEEGNANCKKVKAAFGGEYPEFWFGPIVRSGVARETSAKFGGTDEIRILRVKGGDDE